MTYTSERLYERSEVLVCNLCSLYRLERGCSDRDYVSREWSKTCIKEEGSEREGNEQIKETEIRDERKYICYRCPIRQSSETVGARRRILQHERLFNYKTLFSTTLRSNLPWVLIVIVNAKGKPFTRLQSGAVKRDLAWYGRRWRWCLCPIRRCFLSSCYLNNVSLIQRRTMLKEKTCVKVVQ